MPTPIESLLLPAVLERVLLVLNHVLAAEPAATMRLRTHVGSVLAVQWLVAAGSWPRPPELALRVTPAGLLERVESADASAPNLRVSVELPGPHRALAVWLADKRLPLTVDGDARLADDVAWLVEHLRWDVEHDLARLVGTIPAHELLRFGLGLRDALRAAVQGLATTWSRRRGAGPAASQ